MQRQKNKNKSIVTAKSMPKLTHKKKPKAETGTELFLLLFAFENK